MLLARDTLRIRHEIEAEPSNSSADNRSSLVVGVTIGSFDGFHLGHQALLHRLEQELKNITEAKPASACRPRAARTLLTFEPHPRLFFARTRATTSLFLPLMTAREKVEYVRDAGFEYFIAQRFNESISGLTPEQFVEKHIVGDLKAQVVVVGYDWAFGKGRSGTPESLAKLGEQWGFKVIVVDPVLAGGTKISSSRVRESLSQGKMEEVQNLLARNYSLMGRVVHGDKRGRTIGFPTANLIPQRKQLPPRGVYATLLKTVDGIYPAVTNIGIRPTFGGSRMVVETHILKGEFDLYSHLVTVEFLSRLRDEQKFADKQALISQITHDCEVAAHFHTRRRAD